MNIQCFFSISKHITLIGKPFILVFVDLFSEWVEIIPIKKASRKTIESEFHKRIILHWGTPRVRYTDNSTEFVDKTV